MNWQENICKNCIYFVEMVTGTTECKANPVDKPSICYDLMEEIEEAINMQLEDDN